MSDSREAAEARAREERAANRERAHAYAYGCELRGVTMVHSVGCNAFAMWLDESDDANATLRAERDAAAADLAATRSRLDEAVRLLGRWMFFASGVAFKSTYGEEVEHETDAFLAASQPSPSTPVPLETGGGGVTDDTKEPRP